MTRTAPPTLPNPLNPPPSASSLQGDRKRVAFVTGAARGIGFAIASRLAKDGFDVAINDLRGLEIAVPKIEAVASGARLLPVLGDVSSEEAVKGMVDQVVRHFGYLDVVVANAGIQLVKPLVDVTAEDFDRLFAVNARGVHLCYKYGALHFIKQGTGGKLIAASSAGGVQAEGFLSTYCATKFAVRAINQGAALELARHGITANVYCPGFIETDMVVEADPDFARYTGTPLGGVLQQATTRIPLGRVGEADDIGNVVSFLASRDSDYITGQSIDISGGYRVS